MLVSGKGNKAWLRFQVSGIHFPSRKGLRAPEMETWVALLDPVRPLLPASLTVPQNSSLGRGSGVCTVELPLPVRAILPSSVPVEE